MPRSSKESPPSLERRSEPASAAGHVNRQPQVMKSRSRGRILAAARELFAVSGYQETSMAEVAQKAKVARATIYNNFPDKVSLLAALVEDYLNGYIDIARTLQADFPPAQTTFEHLETMIREGIVWRLQHADLFPVIDLAKHVPGSRWRETNAQSDKVWLDWMMEIHRGNARAGLLRDSLDLDFSIKAMFSMVETTLVTFDTPSGEDLVNEVAHQFALLQWHALYTGSPAEAPLMHQIIERKVERPERPRR
jgi:AcrR family transcriptional regulator